MIRALVRLTAAVLLSAAPAVAQDFNADYKVTGKYDLNIGEATATLYSVDDLAKKRSGVERHEVMGQVFYNIGGRADVDGAPGQPRIEVQIGPAKFPPRNISSVTLVMDGAVFMSEAEIGGSAEISNVSWGDNGALNFDFSSLVKAAKYGSDGNIVAVDPDLPLLEVEGHYEGVVPLN